MSTAYPFSALVGQEQMKLALLLNAVNPAIGGVLIRGEKGTAKSIAARALAKLLPPVKVTELDVEIRTNTGLEYIFLPRLPAVPFVELPLGVTNDRVIGRLNTSSNIPPHFEMGLLGTAHQGVLYVDDVNLLPNHIVDLLLDTASSGTNTVERDGISATHLARFILIGTMNPEEGELRAQFLDRFGLMVTVTGPADSKSRMEIVRQRIAYESDPADFCTQFKEAESSLSQQITEARTRLPAVVISDEILDSITRICVDNQVDGLRADVTLYKTAQTLAAWENREEVTISDVHRSTELVLSHRCRKPNRSEKMRETSPIYPINLIGLDKMKTIVIGGGTVGERKITKLITAGATVQLISPIITDQLQEWATAGRIEWLCRAYQPGDLEGAKLVFATTNHRETNAQIAEEARQLGLLCNVADNPNEGNFHVPAVYWGKEVTVAVSTAGKSPTTARQIRDKIAQIITYET